ncbi:ABC transporter permease [Umezawaea tangerina]|uniref:ABC-2 type transport system permease protein n=1 Tax=Umezawaea tangerina TaxID=84725 RepID=A0A2T0TDH1_9PSEU|nr:ABC-2 family transporter protein [Umezawaea tangerina]PRY43700.1 ABC-2 type transport system permease protein [Umezawaea tangerina]
MAEAIYPRILHARLRGQLSYRASFLLDCLAQAVAQGGEVVVILVLFNRVTALGGFSVDEVLLVYALASTAFGLSDLFAGQLNALPAYIREGTFDVLLLRPLGTLPQVMVSDLPLKRIGRVFTGLVVLGYALPHNDVVWTPWSVGLLVVTPVAGSVIFSGIWVVACSVCFWLVDGQELANTVTYGSNTFTSYPISVYSGWLRRLMAFVVPGAFVAYYPALALLDKPDPLGGPGWLGWVGPVVAVLVAGLAGLVWKTAVRHYRGTGS